MKYAIFVGEDTRILYGVVAGESTPDNAIIVDELPVGNLTDYCYVDGQYVYNPLPKPEPVVPEPDYEIRIAALEEDLAAAKILLGVE